MVVEERQRDIGGFLVGRLLPFRKKRQVGPFTFIDHMGPTTMNADHFMNVDQHPHIGLSTLSYLFKGEVEHRDSLGSHKVIKPGDVAFMTAGKGITHTERTPERLKTADGFEMHGYQIWVALPKELEEMEPRFDFYPAEDVISWEEDGVELKLIAGNAFGRSALLQGFSEMFLLDIYAKAEATLEFKDKLSGEMAIVVVEGEVEENGDKIGIGEMLISKTDEACGICIQGGTRIMIFGGAPLDHEPLLMWNFVASSKEKLEAAKANWMARKFPKIEGDDTYIPFPGI